MVRRSSKRERRSFTPEYKDKVLELVRQGDKSISQICRDLDLTESAVRRWIDKDNLTRGAMNSSSLDETDQQELERLRAEVKRLKMERDVLKKAAAFVCHEHG